MQVRTDLAEEAQDLWKQSAGKTTQLEGVKARSWEDRGVRRHQVQILDERGEKALGKPKGTYETLWVPGDGRPTPEAAEALGEAVASLLDLPGRGERPGGGPGEPGYDPGMPWVPSVPAASW